MTGHEGGPLSQNPPWWKHEAVLPATAVLLVALSALPVWDLARTVLHTEKLHDSGLSLTRLYGEIRYGAEESRRRFLYVLDLGLPNETANPAEKARRAARASEMASNIPAIREADQAVGIAVGRALQLTADPDATAALRQFSSQWVSYTAVRDDMLALVFAGRSSEAAKLEAESGAPVFEKAQATLARVQPLLDAWLSREESVARWAFARGATGLGALLLMMIGFLGAVLWVHRKRRSLLASLEENNEALRAEKEVERQHNRILELISSKEPLETVLDAVVAALHRQQPDPATGCAVLAFQGSCATALVRGLPDEIVPALKRFAMRVAAGEPVDACKEELREAASHEGFPESRFAPVWLRGTEDGGWIVVCEKHASANARSASVSILRAQRAAALAIENRRVYEQLAQQAHFDTLTQLPNRLLFHDRLHQALSHGRRHRTKVAILWLDLDGFKRVNDTLGHRAGDELLCQVAERLLACVRETDTLARLGADEFTVVMKDVRDLAAAMQVAEKLMETLQQPFQVARHDLSIGASIGVSIYPDHGEDVTTVVKSADIAMYRAKSLGKSRVEAFSPSMADAERERLELEIELRAAIASEEFDLHYQPQVDVYGRLAGLEALLRWTRRAKGPLPPGEFIPVAEATGLILPLGAWVLRRACLQCREWMDRGLKVPPVAVNVSAVQLAQTDLAAHVKQCLEEAQMEPRQLELEITESSFLSNAAETNEHIERIRAMGVRISIDDFGTGYSSLSYLHRLPIDRLKIDQSFVRDINNTSGGTASVVRAIVAMAHSLDVSVVAEGVETAGQLEAIREAGCDYVQGFYFHRPLPVDATTTLLARSEPTPERRDLEAIRKGVLDGAVTSTAR